MAGWWSLTSVAANRALFRRSSSKLSMPESLLAPIGRTVADPARNRLSPATGRASYLGFQPRRWRRRPGYHAAMSRHRMAVLLFEQVLPLDFAIPMHVFAREAPEFYDVATATVD